MAKHLKSTGIRNKSIEREFDGPRKVGQLKTFSKNAESVKQVKEMKER